MHNIVISDTSCLIIFNKIGQLEILQKVYDNVITTPEVAQEFSENLPDWIIIREVQDKKYQEFLETEVDYGEASAIALAKEVDNPLLLLDDLKARKLAGKLKLRFTGTLGVITKAKQIGVISAVRPIIDSLLLTDFRISENVIDALLKLNNEDT
jgi:predicted nucleic acid-binding protein